MRNAFGTISFSLALAACGMGQAVVDAAGNKTESAGKPEVWSSADNPAIFSANVERRLEALPRQGEASAIPWAGHYWPVAYDSINYRWDGAASDSPAKKYEKAFGGNGVEDQVSRAHGVDSQWSAKQCSESSECTSDLGEICSKRSGTTQGRCIPTWFGICHAWAPASILLPEPKHPVTKNGVTFKVQDIKALATLAHDRTTSKFVSLRCNSNNRANEIRYDNYGRPADASSSCRDTNPGTYHLLLANYLGVMRQAFVEDRVFDYQVWNQPLRGYRVTELRAVSALEANKLIGASTVGGTTTSRNGTVAKDAWAHQGSFAVTPGASYRVAMTGTGDADLYVKFGVQPADALYDCRPYEGSSAEECAGTVPAAAAQLFVSVKGYAATSSFNLNVTAGGSVPTTYVFNASAASFAFARTEVDYITEASGSTDGNLSGVIDRYTGTDSYEYVLELDAEGRIVGGEWVGSSKQDHPDFVWLPTGVGASSVAGGAITYASVKALLDESVSNPGGTGGDKTVTQSGTLARGEFKHFGPFDVAAGATLTVAMTGTGDADLYVRRGGQSTLTGYDCRPYTSSTNESCIVAGPGPVYVSVSGYATTSDYKLVITFKDGSGGVPPVDPPATVQHLDVSESVAQGEGKSYQLQVPAGHGVRIQTMAPNDVDLYLQINSPPTTSTYAARAYTASGNETVTFTPASGGMLYILVHGYQASTFTLKTSDL